MRCLPPLVVLLACLVAAPPPLAAQEVVFENPRQPGRMKKQLRGYAETIKVWGLVQRVVSQVQSQNEAPPSRQEIDTIDSAWRRGEPPADLVQQLVTNDCAQALQALLSTQPGFSKAFAMDRQGTVVCMTLDAGGYSMADESLFTGAFDGGQGALFVTRPHRDPMLEIDVLEISVPVVDQGEPIGVLSVVRILAPP